MPGRTLPGRLGDAAGRAGGQREPRERILLIDTAIFVAAATRWPHALLGVLTLGADGTYAEAMPTFDMPRDALGVLSRIASSLEAGGGMRGHPFPRGFPLRHHSL